MMIEVGKELGKDLSLGKYLLVLVLGFCALIAFSVVIDVILQPRGIELFHVDSRHADVVVALGVGLLLVIVIVLLLQQSRHEINFRKITCKELEVVGPAGKRMVRMRGNAHGFGIGEVMSYSGGIVEVYSWGGELMAEIGSNQGKRIGERGGAILLYDNEGKRRAVVDTQEVGLRDGGAWATMGIDLDGGCVDVRGAQDVLAGATIGVNENGGIVEVYDKNHKAGAVMGINNGGDGAVSTSDKNGARLGTLKEDIQ